MTSTAAFLLLWTICHLSAAQGQEIITAKPGEDVTLTCRAPNNNIPIIVAEWSRTDLDEEYVLLYRGKQILKHNQHPSYKDRVDLQDRQMKDGDVSLILRNVTTADKGTYECRIVQRGINRRKRANLKSDPISIILLAVVEPDNRAGGGEEEAWRREGGEKEGNSRGYHGLVAGLSVVGITMTAVVVAAAAALRISQRHKKKKSDSPPDEAAVQQLV
ncbi:coxsackievirus and adenovirus receptor-like [Odontesthes bonariensis]|uniref:coxsackievirus and adenovirus receptor-like n=1 Tax=Odontesthes bonariensis TaxID=219752 RepID=UPI003F581D08